MAISSHLQSLASPYWIEPKVTGHKTFAKSFFGGLAKRHRAIPACRIASTLQKCRAH